MGKGAAFDECACYTTRRAARQLGQPPGTSIYVLLPGRRMPIPQLPGATAGARSTDIENSRGSANVISVESQSTRAT